MLFQFDISEIKVLGDLGLTLHFCVNHISLPSAIWPLATLAMVRLQKDRLPLREPTWRLVPCHFLLILQVPASKPLPQGPHCYTLPPSHIFLVII